MKAKIHPTAIVAEGALLDPTVEVGPYCVVEGGARIGAGTRLLGHVTIRGRVTIGKNNTIHPYAVLGGEPQDFKYDGAATEVVIGDGNVIRESMTISRGTSHGDGRTVIGNGNYLMACSHVAHDCILGSHIVLANCALLAGHSRVEDHAYISGQVVVHQFATIGRHAFVTGGSRVPRDAPPYMMLHGGESEVKCVNATGLKRSGFAGDVINALKDAHRVIWSSGLPLPDAVAALKRMHNGHFQEVQYLIEFLLNSTKGKNGRAREAMRGAHPAQCQPAE
jgi:UDP-N-acetylglucosamine acyltransferase